jgi:hypothetical protein
MTPNARALDAAVRAGVPCHVNCNRLITCPVATLVKNYRVNSIFENQNKWERQDVLANTGKVRFTAKSATRRHLGKTYEEYKGMMSNNEDDMPHN